MLKREHKVSHISSEAIFAIPAMKPSKVVFAIIFCLCLMISDVKFETSSYLRSVSHEIFKPISWVIKLPSYLIDTSSNFLSSRSSLNTKLKDLEKENFKLRSSNQLMKKLSVDFERLNSLWSSSALNEDRFIISKKNLLSSNEFQPLLVLDIGRGHDIKGNDVVPGLNLSDSNYLATSLYFATLSALSWTPLFYLLREFRRRKIKV